MIALLLKEYINMKNNFKKLKKSILFYTIIVFIVFIIAYFAFEIFNIMVKYYDNAIKDNIDIKNNKETIYSMFDNFQESKDIFYTSKSLYSERDIGPTIYQIDILAELTDEAYNNFSKQVELQDIQNLEIKINPNNIKYTWKEVKNTQVVKSKNIERASVKNIYLDDNNKTIYMIVLGGN